MTEAKDTNPETPTRRPRRAKRIDESPWVQAWMDDFISTMEDRMGVTMTMDQAADAFAKVAEEKVPLWSEGGYPPGCGEL
jgi:hypothetical protein